MQSIHYKTLSSALVLALLAACGGGGGGSSTPAVTPASSAASSISSSNVSSSNTSSSTASSSVASSSLSSSSSSGSAVTLNQTGNPIYAELTSYTVFLSTSGDDASKLAADKAKANIMLTWQTDEGGFYKHISDSCCAGTKYSKAWTSGSKSSSWLGANGESLGTIDNDATTSELMFLADLYKRSGDTKYRDAARNALNFLLKMQYPSGGFPQVYPARGDTSYSNYVTFNDDAMARVMLVLNQVAKKASPLDAADLFTTDQYTQLAGAIDKGIDFILKAQIKQNGVKTVWCAQHDPVSYLPLGARAYELPSKSGKESVGIVTFLMSQPQTPEIKESVQAAIAWFKSSAVKVADTAYVKRSSGSTDDAYNPITAKPGSTMWYRFYDLDQDKGFFSDRTAAKFYDIMAIEAERRYGYEWGGAYGTKLFTYSESVGY